MDTAAARAATSPAILIRPGVGAGRQYRTGGRAGDGERRLPTHHAGDWIDPGQVAETSTLVGLHHALRVNAVEKLDNACRRRRAVGIERP